MTDPAGSASGSTRTEKSASAFRTISEVADELELPQHVLRFWETKFTAIKPMKRGGGRRYYRPEDVALLKRIRELLYAEGYTIKGVQKLLRERGGKTVDAEPAGDTPPPAAAAAAPALSADARTELRSLLGELEDIRAALRGA
jgi:DNA-binding transcriptional MerR regulator